MSLEAPFRTSCTVQPIYSALMLCCHFLSSSLLNMTPVLMDGVFPFQQRSMGPPDSPTSRLATSDPFSKSHPLLLPPSEKTSYPCQAGASSPTCPATWFYLWRLDYPVTIGTLPRCQPCGLVRRNVTGLSALLHSTITSERQTHEF